MIATTKRHRPTRKLLNDIALLGSCLPRQCGIATFSADLANALVAQDPELTIECIAMSDRNDYVYPGQVGFHIKDSELDSYRAAAEYVNRRDYDVLSVQHEYGIYGGEAGSYLMELLRQAKMPIVTTLHTVLRDPSSAQKAVMDELLQLSERVVVMSKKGVDLLVEVHDASLDKIDLIPHGIPLIRESDGVELRDDLAIDGPMILTFGLLSPDKGIQYAIEAMPKIVREHPGATYVVVGATHPNVRATAGEAYRDSLVKLASDLGVSANIRFVDRFVTKEELVAYLAAMDYYVTPYLNPRQITSGTLAYAVGAGKVVVSTPYQYAEELLEEGRGVLVPFRSGEGIADAILEVEASREARLEMGRRAAEFGAQMLWDEVGKSYLASFARAKQEGADRLRAFTPDAAPATQSAWAIPEMRLDHLVDLSDDTGILQHATYAVPNRAEGYCVDDNARALLLTALLGEGPSLTPELSLLQSRYLAFVLDAFNERNGRFRNFMNYRRVWLEESGSEDSQGRSLWGLGAVVNRCKERGRRKPAKSLFERAAPGLLSTSNLRSWAYVVLATDEYLRAYPHEYPIQVLRQTMAGRLWHRYESFQSDDWPWFERRLTYDNARLPHALIVAGKALGNHEMLEAGLDSLAWLMGVQTDPDGGVFAPIGTNGFYPRGGERAAFDQQPIEAWASVSACIAAHRATGDLAWLDRAHWAFRWYLGENALGLPVYDKSTGGCRDGIHIDRVNENEGAESTLSFLCASAELRAVGAKPTAAAVVRAAEEVV